MFLKIVFLSCCIFFHLSHTMEKESHKINLYEPISATPQHRMTNKLLPFICTFVKINRQRCNASFATRGEIRAHLRKMHSLSANIESYYFEKK